MNEKVLNLEPEILSGIVGINEKNLEHIRNYFPNINIIARGNVLKIIGEPNEIEDFEKKIILFSKFYDKYNRLENNDIDTIMQSNEATLEELFKDTDVIVYSKTGRPIKARTPNQRKMVEEFLKNDLLFAIGPAGTGKTYIAIALAVKALRDHQVQRIILSRPAVEAGEKLGFLPGDLKDKLDPYLQALYDALDDMLPPKKLAFYMENRIIQIAPLAYMRGRTLSNAFVVLDEAQNSTINQLKMFLTRMGENSKFIVTGDITQIDLENNKSSGLVRAKEKLANINGISIVEFNKNDIVRHPLVKIIIEKFD